MFRLHYLYIYCFQIVKAMCTIKMSVVHGSRPKRRAAIASILSLKISWKPVTPLYTTRILCWEVPSITRWMDSINHPWIGIRDPSGSLPTRWPQIVVLHPVFVKIKSWSGSWKPSPGIVSKRKNSHFKCLVTLMIIWIGWFILRMIWSVSSE